MGIRPARTSEDFPQPDAPITETKRGPSGLPFAAPGRRRHRRRPRRRGEDQERDSSTLLFQPSDPSRLGSSLSNSSRRERKYVGDSGVPKSWKSLVSSGGTRQTPRTLWFISSRRKSR